MDRCVRILAVHRSRLILEGLRAVLAARDDLDVIAEVAGVEEAVSLHRLCRPDVTILGARLAGGFAADALDRLRAEFPGCRVVILVAHASEPEVFRAARAGAGAVWREDADPAELVTLVRKLASGVAVAPLPRQPRVRSPRLTPRERQVLQLLATGKRNAAIAQALGIGAETVKTYVGNVFDKLGVSDRGTAAAVALRAGLAELDD